MKRKLFTAIAVILLAAGLAMLIAPRISNRIGEQIAHSTIDDFKALKSKATSDEPTEKKESSEESTQRENSEAESLAFLQASASYQLKDAVKNCCADVHIFYGEKENRGIKKSAKIISNSFPMSALTELPEMYHRVSTM
ncbi:hypothetical protein [Ruminococcus sp.]|uniref:hypothetical protein n=1 Tax=Ruminococcus sp. TaxID=41978 RepID=UPI002E791808|nr:hypothetical protein [Ruminococcus sp.]MEE1264124.1 hypothetical protein [Ruminococcus sp.]